MADETVQELSGLSPEPGVAFELLKRPLEAMADLDVAAT